MCRECGLCVRLLVKREPFGSSVIQILKKTREIEANNTVELCAVDENSNVLRLQGKLVGEEKLPLEEKEKVRRKIVEELPGAADFFAGYTDPRMAIFKFEIEDIIFRSLENVVRAELHFRK